jgi:23S rRNA pseudouridine2605 synthase/23S rRNA pseudouridine2604 synthase
MRLQKYLSQAGICSRRKAEEYIERWLIKVNGETATIGMSVTVWVDKVELLDKAVKEQKEFLYFKVNKPRWVVTTCAQIWEKTILDIIDIDKRVFPIGRLDKETTGLILLTSDGRLANYLMHPRYNHQKEYIVETFGPISDMSLDKMRNGLFILWSYTKKAKVERIASGKFSITISEWRNRQIRRMVEAVGSEVKKLKRIRIENIHLWDLKEWEYKALTKIELKDLFNTLNIEQWSSL